MRNHEVFLLLTFVTTKRREEITYTFYWEIKVTEELKGEMVCLGSF